MKLEAFQSSDIPPYAILSHRWDSEEVSFFEMQSGGALDLAGYSKVKSCSLQAVRDGWKYVWIDSCCIDKSSSAELSEAINSMFQWYRDAQVCYAYLSDVASGEQDCYSTDSAFQRSKWFTRGWTLQELLAPSIVVFFDQDWHEIGTKSSLEGLISSITGIDSLTEYNRASVAQKMSWASKRQTTRLEDMAYCLLGLFGLNLIPIYGEGERAFTRLQLEILSKSDDESLFAWMSTDGNGERGLLARSPASFQHSGDISRAIFNYNRPPYSMTNKGLCIELVLHPVGNLRALGAFYAALNCARKGERNPIAIYLKRLQPEQFERQNTDKLLSLDLPTSGKAEVVYVRQPDDLSLGFYEPPRLTKPCVFLVKTGEFLKIGFSIAKHYVLNPAYGHWDKVHQGSLFLCQLVLRPSDDHKYSYGALLFTDKVLENRDIISADGDPDMFVVLMRSDYVSGRAWVSLFRPEAGLTLQENVRAFNARQSFPSRYIDRISLLLKSRRAVSVALRKIGLPEADGYTVEITIDNSGHLKWGHAGLRRPS